MVIFKKNAVVNNFKIINCCRIIFYLEIVNDHLFSNLNTYRLLDTNPLDDTKFKINNELETLNKNGHISNRLFNKLKLKPNNKFNLGKFYILFNLKCFLFFNFSFCFIIIKYF